MAVDSSTSGTKAVAFDARGRAVAEARRELARDTPHPGWQEQDPRAWWTSTAEVLAELTEALEALGARPVALGLTHQRESFACLDEDGEPVRPGILWLDTRAGPQVRRFGSPEVHARSGKPPSTTPSLYKLLWLREHEPEVLERTRLVLDVHGYLVLQLCGTAATSWASADPMGLVDMERFAWSDELLDLCGLDEQQLPALVAPGEVIGTVTAQAAAATGLAPGLPVVAGAGDGQCAGLGARAIAPGRAYLNLGTGLTLGVHAEDYAHDLAFRTLASPVAGAYTLEALLSSGALSIAWYRDNLARLSQDGGHPNAQLQALAEEVPPGCRGLLFLPYLTSAQAPYWDPAARGAFVGLDDGHATGDLYRAVLEGLALEERLCLELIEDRAGTEVHDIVALGGAVRSTLFTQVIADVLGRPLQIAEEPETTALGAAILAAAAVGFGGAQDLRQAAEQMSRVAATREPDPATAGIYDGLYAVYRDLYPALRDVFERLAEVREAPGAPGSRSSA